MAVLVAQTCINSVTVHSSWRLHYSMCTDLHQQCTIGTWHEAYSLTVEQNT